MRKNVVALLTGLGGLLAAWIVAFTPMQFYFLNYREMNIPEWLRLWATLSLALYLLTVYITAFVFQKIPTQESEIEPSFLALGGIIGLVVGLPVGSLFVSFLPTLMFNSVFPIPALASILGIRIACRCERIKSNFNLRVLLFRVLMPSLLALTLIWLHNSSFPGVMASAQVRQQWAYREFRGYNGVVDTIKTCQPITERVGSVKFVAPTQGRNYVISDPGSSGHSGELTLEVIGEKSAGVANSSFHHDTAVGQIRFTYQGRTEEILCRS
ncbi:MAG TPA: hypothetical protein V6D15_21965 [Oculatellaceae cyanobacterium]